MTATATRRWSEQDRQWAERRAAYWKVHTDERGRRRCHACGLEADDLHHLSYEARDQAAQDRGPIWEKDAHLVGLCTPCHDGNGQGCRRHAKPKRDCGRCERRSVHVEHKAYCRARGIEAPESTPPYQSTAYYRCLPKLSVRYIRRRRRRAWLNPRTWVDPLPPWRPPARWER